MLGLNLYWDRKPLIEQENIIQSVILNNEFSITRLQVMIFGCLIVSSCVASTLLHYYGCLREKKERKAVVLNMIVICQ